MNLQMIEKPVLRDDLDVVDIFPTIQGEGPFTGRPAVFVRLAGCNLRCPACDTDYTSNRRYLSVDRIALEVLTLGHLLVVITGGEPFRQGCGPLTKKLLRLGEEVQFETNGTLSDPTMDSLYKREGLSIVCSPKTAKVNEGLIEHISAFKYILKDGEVDEADGLPTSSLNCGARPCRPWEQLGRPVKASIYVQPMDDGNGGFNKANVAAAIKSCMTFGYILSLQTHKLAGLP